MAAARTEMPPAVESPVFGSRRAVPDLFRSLLSLMSCHRSQCSQQPFSPDNDARIPLSARRMLS